jgi:magnesium transporter
MKLKAVGDAAGRSARKAGLPPGALVYTGDQTLDKATIDIMDYDADDFRELKSVSASDTAPFRESPTVTWMNVIGLHDVELIGAIGERFDLHPLVLEDVLSTGQRPKFENLGDYLFIVLKTLHWRRESSDVRTEQISLVLGPSFVVSFQEIPEDPFDNVRERIRTGRGRIRTMGADYLAYALIDAVVDNYFVALESLGERIEVLSEETMGDPTEHTVHDIQSLRHILSDVRRSVWPLREVISAFQREESPLLTETTDVYVRDVYDHTIQVVETIEAYRDIVSGLFDMYLSSVSNRMNEVMKVLTIIATIFIPITFVAGVYGMNFHRMPELAWAWGYPLALFAMLSIALTMVFYFKRKRWL